MERRPPATSRRRDRPNKETTDEDVDRATTERYEGERGTIAVLRAGGQDTPEHQSAASHAADRGRERGGTVRGNTGGARQTILVVVRYYIVVLIEYQLLRRCFVFKYHPCFESNTWNTLLKRMRQTILVAVAHLHRADRVSTVETLFCIQISSPF